MIFSPAYGLEYIIEWYNVEKTEIPFDELMYDNYCTDNTKKNVKQAELFRVKNRKRYEKAPLGSQVRLQTCDQKEVYTDRELGITGWDEVTTTKDFILSRALEERGCSDGTIFQRHIPHLKRKNNYSKDVDVNRYFPGQKLMIQRCDKKEVVKATPPKKENPAWVYFILGREEIYKERDLFLEIGYNKFREYSIYQRLSGKEWTLGGFYYQRIFNNNNYVKALINPDFAISNTFDNFNSLNIGVAFFYKNYGLKIYNDIVDDKNFGFRFDLIQGEYGLYLQYDDFTELTNFGVIFKY